MTVSALTQDDGHDGSTLTVGPNWTEELPGLIERALTGDEHSWCDLVDRFSGLVWKVLNTYDLSASDREEAFASTFFRLFEKLSTLREPRALPKWLATTARNEANAVCRTRRRLVPTDQLPLREVLPGDHDRTMLDDELLAAVMAAFATLPPAGQALLRLLTTVPPLSYEEIAALVGVPVGSIGPTRQRYLQRLRTALVPYLEGGMA
jgi:RNA polymerase sigma factor (sigma-70 family)